MRVPHPRCFKFSRWLVGPKAVMTSLGRFSVPTADPDTTTCQASNFHSPQTCGKKESELWKSGLKDRSAEVCTNLLNTLGPDHELLKLAQLRTCKLDLPASVLGWQRRLQAFLVSPAATRTTTTATTITVTTATAATASNSHSYYQAPEAMHRVILMLNS